MTTLARCCVCGFIILIHWCSPVLDLVQVTNGFGKSSSNPNSDGVVNILDLVFVAQQFNP